MNTNFINITVNGKSCKAENAIILPEFLKSLNLVPDHVIVELNKKALTPSETKQTQLKDGDSLEIVRIVAGG